MENEAATRMQSAVRGRLSRRNLGAMDQAAIVIQKTFRGFALTRKSAKHLERIQKRMRQILPIVLVVCGFCDMATDTAVGITTLHKPNRQAYAVAMLSLVAACQIMSTLVVTLRHKGGKGVLPLWLTVVATVFGLGQGATLLSSFRNNLVVSSSLVRAPSDPEVTRRRPMSVANAHAGTPFAHRRWLCRLSS
jgi:hypothetical protein